MSTAVLVMVLLFDCLSFVGGCVVALFVILVIAANVIDFLHIMPKRRHR